MRILIPNPIVSVDWLNDHLQAENLVILDGTIKKVFDSSLQQIPNARFFDIKNTFSDTTNPFPNAFPSQEQFQREARALGIHNTSAIVVSDDKGIYSSARVWWLFKAMGFENIAVLDGGFPAWQAAGYTTENMHVYQGATGDFDATYNPELMRYFDGVAVASKHKTHTIIDARSERRFKCLEPEPRAGLRMGNIPNSVSLPFMSLLEDGKFKSKADLEELFKTVITDKQDAIIFSCGSGITACVLALGATLCGYKNIAVYDGSWTEWGSLVTE